MTRSSCAIDFYSKAIALQPEFADAQRGLGLSLIKIGRRNEGCMVRKRYLQLKPGASEAAMIGMTIASSEDTQ